MATPEIVVMTMRGSSDRLRTSELQQDLRSNVTASALHTFGGAMSEEFQECGRDVGVIA